MKITRLQEQRLLEYFMVYGWALIVILVVVAILISMGVLEIKIPLF